MRNGVAYLSRNIKLDKNYKSVLGYTEQQMLNLMTSQANLVYSANNLSFTREDGEIILDVPYSDAIKANYLAFQNPNYSNKWFFAFIDDVIYTGERQSKIKYTIDLFTTWWSYWSPKACFVIREHVLSDGIGEHTVPENLETGDYLTVDMEKLEYNELDGHEFYPCVGISEDILLPNDTPNKLYNGIVSGLTYVVPKTYLDLTRLLTRYNSQGKIDAIYTIFMIPASYVSLTSSITWRQDATGLINFAYIPSGNSAYFLGTFGTARPTRLGTGYVGYLPKNNKLLTYPYIFIQADNNCGVNVIYKYEYFANPLNIEFEVLGSISAGCNIKCVPKYYKELEYNYNESFNCAKFPIGSWINDVYTNWLTQNGVNIGISFLSNMVQIAGGALMASSGAGALTGASQITSGALGIAQTVGSIYQHNMIPNQAEGNINSSDVMFSANMISPVLYRMTIKEEFARIIDDYWTRQGYLVNRVKVPNMGHRQNFNFIQIASEDNLCYPNNHDGIMIPASALDFINGLFRNGVTIWNNHENFGDYSVSNNIVE